MNIQDPFQYIGRVHRDASGVAIGLDIIRNSDLVRLSSDPAENEFITFVTVVDLNDDDDRAEYTRP